MDSDKIYETRHMVTVNMSLSTELAADWIWSKGVSPSARRLNVYTALYMHFKNFLFENPFVGKYNFSRKKSYVYLF